MKLIKDIDAVEGKTIKSVKIVDFNTALVLTFTDGTCAFFDIYMSKNLPELNLSREMDDNVKIEAGLLSNEGRNLIKKYEVKAKDHTIEQETQRIKESQYIPEGSIGVFCGLHYKIGRFDRLYYWNIKEWVRSSKDKNHIISEISKKEFKFSLSDPAK